MSNAGYGNHDEPPPTQAGDYKAAPAARTSPETPRPPDKDISTPGDGAGPDAPVGKDVDPGVG